MLLNIVTYSFIIFSLLQVRRTLFSQREIARERESSLTYSLDASREFLQSSPTWSREAAAPAVAAAALVALVEEEEAVTEEEGEAHLVEAMEEEEEATAVEEEEGALQAAVMEEEAVVTEVEEEGEAHPVADTTVEEEEVMEEEEVVVMAVVEVEEEAAEIATIRGTVATEHRKTLIEEAPTRAAQPTGPEMTTPAVGAAQGGRPTMTTTTTRHTSRSLSQ